MTMGQRVRAVVWPMLFAAALVSMAFLLVGRWRALGGYSWPLHAEWLAPAALFVLAGWAIEIWMWQRLLDHLDTRLPFSDVARIWFLSAVTRYLPGNVAQAASLTLLGRDRGVPPERALWSFSLFQIVHILTVGPLVAAYVLFADADDPLLRSLAWLPRGWVMLAALPALLLLSRPQWALGLLNRALARLGRRAELQYPSTGQLLVLFAISLAGWGAWCGAFATIAQAVLAAPPPVGSAESARVAISYPVAYVAGFASFFTPSGLGVREGVLVLVLAPIVGTREAAIVTLAMRIWEVGLEALVVAVVLALGRLFRPRVPRVAE